MSLLAGVLAATGCARAEGTRTTRTRATPARAPASVVDSAVPRDQALRVFRVALPEVDGLSGGARSREELVRRFVRALETSDTGGLRQLVLTRQEYAWIYYPSNPQGLPPYDLSPGLLWFLIETRSRIGIRRALEQRGGAPLRYLRTQCDPKPNVEGENRVWGPCTITRRQERGDTVVERLFGPIIERRGRFKFVSYANRLD